MYSLSVLCGTRPSDRGTEALQNTESYPSAPGKTPVKLLRTFEPRVVAVIANAVHGAFPPHTFRDDGLLVVNPEGRHPIFDMVERAEKQWEQKLKAASKTYLQAVTEYRRRYRRSPPPGFDRWWSYVKKNGVQLPDEYDQIYHDLEPFWGIKTVDLKAIQREWEDHRDSYTLAKKLPNDPNLRRELLTGAYQMVELMEAVQHLLPPFRAVFSPHDNPNVFVAHALKAAALVAANSQTKIRMRDLPRPHYNGWLSACSPNSSALVSSDPAPPDTKTFIYDHRATMDVCNHPTLLRQHGQLLSHGIGPGSLHSIVPQFSYSSTSLHMDIHVTPTLSWVDDIPRRDDPKFEDKADRRLLWRGAETGIRHDHTKEWRLSHRDRLVAWANELNGTTRVLRSPVSETERVGSGEDIQMSSLNPAMLDIAFAGQPLSCSKSKDQCELLLASYEWRPKQSIAEAGQYKYIMDVDGNGWSSRFKRLMTSNSLIFKSTIYPEWYSDRVAPWVHYVPVKVDYSDLHDSLSFFRGNLVTGQGAHEEMASKIARAGREWSKSFWRKEDMIAYMFRLFLEYARVMSNDRDSSG
ncbi:glycosyltransferase family 90 protein [Hydnomerulius pinastri MD-312]|uniref:Glycosyltransferase family 90 protein n=1 Tax=Hydnomerulius pinastri MD-312 TaxID=994086 RepID=A0A0C9W8T2_9AGAM|nr:glycosyltransferase family 90 protein [Hydnomerulius pinastri MD-312]